jgi:hypothetical protein
MTGQTQTLSANSIGIKFMKETHAQVAMIHQNIVSLIQNLKTLN